MVNKTKTEIIIIIMIIMMIKKIKRDLMNGRASAPPQKIVTKKKSNKLKINDIIE
jgi:hypothetical protein